jgi:zinc-ribbon domain
MLNGERMFCKNCGKELAENTIYCPYCGGQNIISPTKNIQGWNWGAFLLSWIWSIGNGVWIGLLALIPYVGFIMAIVLGVKGNEWAWKQKQWKSVEDFKKTQSTWTKWAVGFYVSLIAIGILAAVLIPSLWGLFHPD